MDRKNDNRLVGQTSQKNYQFSLLDQEWSKRLVRVFWPCTVSFKIKISH